jgi:hypothetical protein
MSPLFSTFNAVELGSPNREQFKNCFFSEGCVADKLGFGISKFGTGVCDSFTAPTIGSSFDTLIPIIIGISSKEQMVEAHTIFNVTMMTNAHSFGDFPEVKNPRYAVGLKRSVSKLVELPVSIFVLMSSPKPASIGFVNSGPKSFFGSHVGSVAETIQPVK